MTPEIGVIFGFLDTIFLQGDLFGIRGEQGGPLGSFDPIIKGMALSCFAMIGFSILINFFNAGIRKKLVDQVKQCRFTP